MLGRLLLAVLTAAGPMPVGACTCAAAGGSPSLPAPTAAAAGVKPCGCQAHAADAARPTDQAGSPHRCCLTPADLPARPDRHHGDCPAANPRPAASPAAVTTADDLPADSAPTPAATSDAVALTRRSPAASPDPGPPPLPLYLSLRSLRI